MVIHHLWVTTLKMKMEKLVRKNLQISGKIKEDYGWKLEKRKLKTEKNVKVTIVNEPEHLVQSE